MQASIAVLAVLLSARGAFAAVDPPIEELLKKLESGHYKQRDPAIEALVNLGPAAVPALMGALEHKKWLVREGAVVVLGRLKEPTAIPSLMANLKHGSGHVLYEPSIKSLRQIGPAATPFLVEALTGSDSQMRYGAAVVLESMEDARAVEGLLASLKHADPEVRRHAARTLGRRKDASAVTPLLTLAAEGQPAERAAAVSVLGKLADPRAVELLGGLLASGDEALREAAARALGEIGSDEALRVLDDNKHVAPAAEALKRADTRGKPVKEGTGVAVTLIGIARHTELPGMTLDCSAKEPCEFAEVRVRLEDLKGGRQGLVLVGSLRDAKGKPQGQVLAPILDTANPGEKQSLSLVFRVRKDATLKSFELLGATLDIAAQ